MTIKNRNQKSQEYFCEICDYKCYHNNDFNKHLMTLKHKNKENTTIKSSSKSQEYFCELCNYRCSNRYDYNKHIMTLKHKNKGKSQIKIPKEYTCECGKKYKHAASLHNHKRKCNSNSSSHSCMCGKVYMHLKSLNYHKKKCNIIHNESGNNNQQHNINDLLKQIDIIRELIIEHKKKLE